MVENLRPARPLRPSGVFLFACAIIIFAAVVGGARPAGTMFDRCYRVLVRVSSNLRTPFLLAVGLYWCWQFMETGWGKLTEIGNVVQFFTELGIPAPALNACLFRLWSLEATCFSFWDSVRG